MPAVLSLQQVLTALVLPPLGLVIACLFGGILAWGGARRAGPWVVLSAALVLLLATPAIAGLLMFSLERELGRDTAQQGPASPGAIIVLGAEVAHGSGGAEVGPLTLERLRAGAALHRRTGLPLLVTGGVLSPGDPAIAVLMARSLAEDFGTPARWIEAHAADTRDNAAFSAALLRADGIGSAYVVSHAWHLPRALAAFARQGLATVPAPLRLGRAPDLSWADWMPRPDRLPESWFALREWVGRLVYALRD
ncbi:uncharacterized SAM-binding protein YcdF (DUF218 family) [Humitalea rosea]|uniref:Uncharacterized SAM-binding protein YcdF (DUF218 family) n=1 Tax=Humitalea rosea TaxID=990373 RepID=A0A2W7IIP8_9PROT|nr:YdcF family protein [Humitalea rosea]PZW46770.1 uncharacterized SAM-binding protein YcdF (DUF218 family) [Humitalea rosea]